MGPSANNDSIDEQAVARLAEGLPDDTTDPAFTCDCMLGGLAKWLRAAGYDATWQYHAEDGDLVRRARSQGRIIATSDSRIMERRAIRLGHVKSVFVPGGLSAMGMLRHVARELALDRRQARCMACGGKLTEIDKARLEGVAPPKAYARCDRFQICGRCKKLFWNGTHWKRIAARLDEAFAAET